MIIRTFTGCWCVGFRSIHSWFWGLGIFPRAFSAPKSFFLWLFDFIRPKKFESGSLYLNTTALWPRHRPSLMLVWFVNLLEWSALFLLILLQPPSLCTLYLLPYNFVTSHIVSSLSQGSVESTFLSAIAALCFYDVLPAHCDIMIFSQQPPSHDGTVVPHDSVSACLRRSQAVHPALLRRHVDGQRLGSVELHVPEGRVALGAVSKEAPKKTFSRIF